jgi:hypothetical protein
MRKVRDVLRLKAGGLSKRGDVLRSRGLSREPYRRGILRILPKNISANVLLPVFAIAASCYIAC